jgi:hypothetical protein
MKGLSGKYNIVIGQRQQRVKFDTVIQDGITLRGTFYFLINLLYWNDFESIKLVQLREVKDRYPL